MTSNPYAGDFGPGSGMFEAPARTSALAVTSLVLSLICCIPGFGLLGAGLGVGALLGIGGSNGRVGGRGLAAAGIIIGILVTLAWAGAYVAARQMMGQASQVLFGSMNQAMVAVEAGDFDAARQNLGGRAGSATDEQFESFRAGYRAAYGSFQSVPTDWMEIFAAYAEVGQLIQNYQGRQNLIPIPASFDNGRALMLAIVDPQGGPSGSSMLIPLEDLWLVLPDGTELRLLSPGGAGAAPAGSEAGPGEAPGAPDDDGP
jgi:hypothetical protein